MQIFKHSDWLLKFFNQSEYLKIVKPKIYTKNSLLVCAMDLIKPNICRIKSGLDFKAKQPCRVSQDVVG